MAEKKYILDEATTGRKLKRMAYEISENNIGEHEIILAGIEENGVVIAREIRKLLAEITPCKISLINVSLNKREPAEIKLSENGTFDDKVIIIVDDVANSGKTLLYALKPFLEYQPKKIQILVLVERTHKAFAIKPDYVGISLSTTIQEHIFVEVQEDKVVGAWME